MPVVRIADPADDRLADYVGLTDVALRTRQEPARALYMAESSSVIRRAIEAGHRASFLPDGGEVARRPGRRADGGPSG